MRRNLIVIMLLALAGYAHAQQQSAYGHGVAPATVLDAAITAIDSANITDGGITTADIRTAAITAAKIAADAVGSSEIATDAVGAAEIAADALLWNEIGDAGADATTALGAHETDFTSTIDASGEAVITITNTDADAANDNAFLDLRHNDGADANVFYLRFIGDNDGTPVTDLSLSQTALSVGSGITSTFNNTVNAIGAPGINISNGATSAGTMRLLEDTDDGSNYTQFSVPAMGANITYTLPNTDGENLQQLQTNGTGTLTWGAIPPIIFAVDSASGLTSDTTWVWTNWRGSNVTVDSIVVYASSDDYAISIVERGVNGNGGALVDAVTASTNGVNTFYTVETTITAATIEAWHQIGFKKPASTGKTVNVRIHYH